MNEDSAEGGDFAEQLLPSIFSKHIVFKSKFIFFRTWGCGWLN